MLSCIHKKKGGEHNEGTKACRYFGIGERCSLYEYFTLYGLELAATFDNISLLLDEEEAE